MVNSSHQNPLILSLETSGRIGSVALAQGPTFLGQNNFSAPMKHSAEIFPAICQLLDKLGKSNIDIQQVYISAGPGSFTGLRIASTIAKIMNLANNLKIVAIDTLDAIAENAIDPEQFSEINKIAVILDAKRGKFFIAAYEKSNFSAENSEKQGIWQKSTEDLLLTPSEFHSMFKTDKTHIALLGEGLMYYKSAFSTEKVAFLEEKYWSPQAKNIHKLGYQKALRNEFADPISLSPIYLRLPV
jgi:tRNA threonylcarbamoyladenosine biosynthesis protein TsaB